MCGPGNHTIARTLVQINAGSRSQFTALTSAIILILVLVLLGPLFEDLPKAVLAAVLVTALRTLWFNICDFIHFTRRSYWDGAHWAATFLSTTALNVDYGLAVGILFSIFLSLYRGFK